MINCLYHCHHIVNESQYNTWIHEILEQKLIIQILIFCSCGKPNTQEMSSWNHWTHRRRELSTHRLYTSVIGWYISRYHSTLAEGCHSCHTERRAQAVDTLPGKIVCLYRYPREAVLFGSLRCSNSNLIEPYLWSYLQFLAQREPCCTMKQKEPCCWTTGSSWYWSVIVARIVW